jgi:hypothetical protein
MVLMWLFALLLAACGLGIGGLAIVMGAEGDLGVLAIFVPIAVLVLYGAYLFGRDALRALRVEEELADDQLGTPDPETEREFLAARKGRRAILPVALVVIVSAALAPGPGTFKVVAVVIAALGVFVGLAATVAPKRQRRSGR